MSVTKGNNSTGYTAITVCWLLAALLSAGMVLAAPPPSDDLLWIDQLDQLDLELMDMDPDRLDKAQPAENTLPVYTSFTLGRDNRHNRLTSLSLQLPFREWLSLDAAWGKSAISDAEPSYTTRHRQLGIGSNYKTGFNWHIAADDWGNDGTIETADTLYELAWRTGSRWNFALQYETGDVTLFTNPAFPRLPKSVQVERDAWGLSADGTASGAAWWLSYLKRNYDRKLSALNTSLLLQSIIQSDALDQAYALASDEAVLGYEWYLQGADIGIEYSRVISVIDNASSNYLALSYRYYAGDSITLSGRLQDSLGEGVFTLSLGVGILW